MAPLTVMLETNKGNLTLGLGLVLIGITTGTPPRGGLKGTVNPGASFCAGRTPFARG
jgi:hypothetical protein